MVNSGKISELEDGFQCLHKNCRNTACSCDTMIKKFLAVFSNRDVRFENDAF